MRIVVIGGNGIIGERLVNILAAKGHDVVSASLSSGVDTVTGKGITEALSGARVVADVAESPSFEYPAVLEFFVASTHNLLAAEKAAGVSHHVALSVVGVDQVKDSAYFRAKAVQEGLIRASSLPFTIVRSTQFLDFMDKILQLSANGDVIRIPPALIQPVAPGDVADTLAETYYNEYFPGNAISMPPPLQDGQVSFDDDAPRTVQQYSKDIAAFLAWAAEPHLVSRKRIGFQVMGFLMLLTVLLYFTKKKVRSTAR